MWLLLILLPSWTLPQRNRNFLPNDTELYLDYSKDDGSTNGNERSAVLKTKANAKLNGPGLDNNKEDRTSGKESREVLKAKAKGTKAKAKLNRLTRASVEGAEPKPTLKPPNPKLILPLQLTMGYQTPTCQSTKGHLTPTTGPLRKPRTSAAQSTMGHPTMTRRRR